MSIKNETITGPDLEENKCPSWTILGFYWYLVCVCESEWLFTYKDLRAVNCTK